MEKLLELLNEREKTVNGVQYPGWCKEHLEYQCHGPRVINKKFGFIQWLVDNDKIDYHNVLRTGYEMEDGVFYHYDDYYCLLMLLSISDTPIEDLISYLK